MGTNSPFWVPGEAEREDRERLEDGVTGLYGDLPPGVGPLLGVAAEHVARAFDAYAHGNWELCDALLAEGQGAAGEIFTYLAERVASPSYPYRVDSPHWDAFLAHLAVTVLAPPPPPPPPPPAAESEAKFRERLHQMVLDAEARKAARAERAPRPSSEPDLSKPGGLADELRAMGLM